LYFRESLFFESAAIWQSSSRALCCQEFFISSLSPGVQVAVRSFLS
jgi:hypothetical protein